MQLMPIDLTAIIAVIMGISIVLIPVAGLTVRFAFKPFAESLARLLAQRDVEEVVAISERRIALLEQQVESLEHTVERLEAGQAFDRELQRPSSGSALPGPGGEGT